MLDAVDELSVLDALKIAVLAVDAEGLVAFANEEASLVFAGPGTTLVGRGFGTLIATPESRGQARRGYAALQSADTWNADLALTRADGSTFVASVTASATRGPTGEVTGAVAAFHDVTEARRAQAEASASEERLRLAHSAAQLGTWQWDMRTGLNAWDAQQEAIFGLPPGGFAGTFEAWSGLVHPEDRAGVFAAVEEAMENRSSYVCRHRVLHPDGAVRWVEGVGQVLVDEDGNPTGTIGCSRDVTERVEAERVTSDALVEQQSAAARADLLQNVTADLARAESADDVGRVLAGRLHATLGVLDAGVFFVDRRTGRLRLAASFGYDPWVETIHEALVHADPPQTGIETPRGLLTGDSLGARYPALRAVNERLARSFAVAVPVKPTDLSDGVMMFGFSQERGLSGAEAVLLDTLAGQCAIAVERAELLRRTREIADHLQSSLAASPLPENPSVELAAHYAPGGDELEHVGGDWYDVVETTGGGTAIVVGDVMGRGVQAATSMIRIRGGIRGLLTVDPTPDVVLDAGDRLLLRDAPEQFVTAMCVLVDPAAGLLFLSNAGHVPALVIDTDGTVAVVESASGVPLGVPHEEPRSVEVLPIGPGTTVVLVTDGVVETRERDLDEGIAGLAARAAALAGAPLQELVDGLAALAGDNPDDDVTVLAARLT